MRPRRPLDLGCVSLALVMLFAAESAVAQAPPPGWDPQRFLSVSDVRAGMKGVGRTVLRGTEIVEFQVEILGVMENVTPQGSMVLASLAGQNLETSGIVAGMSGSPIFIDGKLLGALAFGWAFSSQPIAGITPIEDMLRMEARPAGSAQGGSPSRSGWPMERWEALLASRGAEALARVGDAVGTAEAGVGDGALPLAISGLRGEAARTLAAWGTSRGWIPIETGAQAGVSAPDSSGAADELLPGSALAVELARGDMRLAAIGTVTWREGNRIWAFGHPMFNQGAASYPLASAEIVTVLPRLSSSFKMGGPRRSLGAITRDYNAGIMGDLGPIPGLIPMGISLTYGGKTHRVQVEILDADQLTPALSGLLALSSAESFGRPSGAASLRLRTRVDLADGRSISSVAALAGFAPPTAFAGEVARVVGLVHGNPFEPVEIGRIEVEATLKDEIEATFLDRVSVAPGSRRPGDTLALTLHLRDYRGQSSLRETTFPLPAELPPGSYRLQICDAAQSAQAEGVRAPGRYVPRSLAQLGALLEDAPPLDALVLRLVGEGSNPVVQGREMPRLPASLQAVLKSPYASGRTQATGGTVWREDRLTLENVVLGCEELTVTVEAPR